MKPDFLTIKFSTMGKYDSGILGGFRGKIGTVVGGKWKGIEYMRFKGPSKRKNNAPGQIEQQAKFALATDMVSNMSDLFKITYKSYEQQMTARNKAVSGIVNDAITGTYPDFRIDFSKVLISKGKLHTQLSPSMAVSAGILTWQWKYDGRQTGANGKDRSIVVAFCPFFNHCLYVVYGPERESNTATLDVVPFMGQTIHTWLSFITEDGGKVSDSIYTGELIVA
jgi:hypothetical protein